MTSLYENHKTQALAYLYGLSDFQFNEVFILYWFITKLNYNDTYDVYNYRIFKLTRTENNKNFIVNTFYKLESIQQRVPYSFPPQQINYKKCVNCSYFPYCENKKGSNAFVELLPLNTNVSGDN